MFQVGKVWVVTDVPGGGYRLGFGSGEGMGRHLRSGWGYRFGFGV